MRKSLSTLAWLVATTFSPLANAQSTSETVVENGVTYQVTRQVIQRSVPTTEYQTREQKVYRPQVTTQYQSYQQTYLTPVTEYQWVSRMHGAWNPFQQPYYTTELAPVTRWEARPSTVQVPVARTDWVEETRTTQVPVTTYHTVADEISAKRAISVAPGAGTAIASRPIGGQQLDKDPPSGPSPLRSSSDAYRR